MRAGTQSETLADKYREACEERDRYLRALGVVERKRDQLAEELAHIRGASVDLAVAGGELLAAIGEARKEDQRLRAELELSQQHAANRGETILAMTRERETLLGQVDELTIELTKWINLARERDRR